MLRKQDTDASLSSTNWRAYAQRLVAGEISRLTRYADRVVQWRRLPHDKGGLLDAIDCAEKQVADEVTTHPDDTTVVLLNGNVNHHLDIEGLLRELEPRLQRQDRVVLVAYNPYARALYTLANRLGLRKGELPSTFVTHDDLSDLAKLAGYEVCRFRPAVFLPLPLPGVASVVNRIAPAVPALRALPLVNIVTLRPLKTGTPLPKLSVVIPARNERGNIQPAIDRLMACAKDLPLEIIFVEGNSKDGTWEEIQRVIAEYRGPFSLKSYKQSGKGKADAVRLGFANAEGELLTILDADLTMPPELLHRFYDAYRKGLADFINGSRLVYPMEGEAMRFLNRLGNKFFAKSLSYVLGTTLTDSLCGTKLLRKKDYERIVAWRQDFGDFDPFGDFELLFGASVLGLGVIDVPVHYRARTYGETNISRFRNGAELLRMTTIGLIRLAMGG